MYRRLLTGIVTPMAANPITLAGGGPREASWSAPALWRFSPANVRIS